MPEFKRSMEKKGISTELIQENKVDILQTIIAEDELVKVFQQCKHQQIPFRHNFNKHIMLHEKDINELIEDFDDLGHATSHLDKNVRMVKIQCDKIAETRDLILIQ
jgi:hypothetical protein